MNGHAKRAIKMLEALDFRLDNERSRKGEYYYWHPNQPEQRVKVFAGLTEGASKAIQRKANTIAETGWTGPKTPTSIRARARITRVMAKRERDSDKRARNKREAQAEAEHQQREQLIEATSHQREIEELMQPGYGR